MTSGESKAFATRLPVKDADRVQAAVDQTGLSRSDLVARALRYYLEENPDGIPAFGSSNPNAGPLEKAGILPPETGSDRIGTEER